MKSIEAPASIEQAKITVDQPAFWSKVHAYCCSTTTAKEARSALVAYVAGMLRGSTDLHAAIMNLPIKPSVPEFRGEALRGYKVGHRDARHAAAELASAALAARSAPEVEYTQDPMDIIRTLICIADRIAQLTPEQREIYPSPLSDMSPLMEAAREACVERGFTAGGLSIAGSAS